MENMLKDINPIIDSSIFKADRAYVEFCYVFDMIITGIILVISVIMERTFISKEQGEIALMKAIGTRNRKIYLYHTLRFLFIGIISVIISEILVMPLTHLCMDPIFKMMGLEVGVNYVKNPSELYAKKSFSYR